MAGESRTNLGGVLLGGEGDPGPGVQIVGS